ncbi:ATP-binding protein [Nocardioides flavescens]|uniref:ATP-binding protein n=1 Tax=Nocardioides flavescens TaxID=2691959 RepID=UPI00137007D3
MTTLEDVGHASWRGRAPLVVAGTIPVAIALSLPWRAEALPPVPGFPGLWLALVLVCDLLTVSLLLSQYRAGGSPRLLPLSWAFLWSAGMAVQIAIATPGLLSDEPLFAGDPNSLAWLWIARHVMPPLFIATALAPWPAGLEEHCAARTDRVVRSLLAWVTVAMAFTGVGLLVGLAPDLLPPVVGASGRLTTAAGTTMLVVNAGFVAASVWGVAKRRTRNGLEAWALVAAVAFAGDVWLVMLAEERWTVTSYATKLLGLAASAFVAAAVLRDASRLHADTVAMAARLTEQNAELLEAQRLRDHLTAVVSHDLRTPLAGLQGYLELLGDDGLDSPLAQRMLERSHMLTRRLTLLTEDLLAAATLEHGDLVVSPEHLDLGEQLALCASGFPDLEVRVECRPDLAAYADPLRLQQVLANLVRNAQKHGAEPVIISASPVHSAGGGGVVIEVADAGEGVPEEFVPRLFERYTQGPRTATGGSGLGLSVVRDLVEAHDGTIRYDASRNAFAVTLPLAPEGSSATAPVASPFSAASAPTGWTRTRAGAPSAS